MTLQTPRLLLRPLCEADAAGLHAIEGDPRVTRYLPFDPRTAEQARAYIEDDLKHQESENQGIFDFALVRRDTLSSAADGSAGVMIGRCGVGVHRAEHRAAAIWYVLSPAQWGKGYAFEAASAVLDFAFDSLLLHRVWADCDPRNLASCRLATKLGMTLEGRLRENYFLKGEWCGTSLYAILAHEWHGRKR